jgi:hypothetical protein
MGSQQRQFSPMEVGGRVSVFAQVLNMCVGDMRAPSLGTASPSGSRACTRSQEYPGLPWTGCRLLFFWCFEMGMLDKE